MTDLYNLPDLTISKDVIERIQFSVSSRNAEAKLSECATHVFAAQYSDNPRSIKWQYVASGVACLLRNRELHKNGRKYMWSMSLCLYNVNYGVLVWKAKLLSSCDYTAVADNFHVFALGEVNVVVGLMFSSREQACELNTTYMTWHQERMRDDGKKGPATVVGSAAGANTPAIRFRKEQISKPCNFQHIQGTQALDECLEIEKIKADILAAFFGLGTSVGRSEVDTSDVKKKGGKKKKDQGKSRPTFKEISVPVLIKSPPTSPPMSDTATSSPYPAHAHHQDSTSGYPANFEPQSAVQPHPQDSMYSNFPYPPEGAVNGDVVREDSPPPPPIAHEMAAYDREHEAGYPRQPSLSYETEQYEHQQHYINLEPEPPLPPQSPQESYSNSTPYSRENSQASHGSQSGGGGGGDALQHYANLEPAQPFVEENPYDNLPSVTTNNGNQDNNYGYDSPPPRLDFNLEKELADSFLFQSPLTAN